jgi:hypothetical protein
MSERRLREALREVEPPGGEEARERARALVGRAFAERSAQAPRRSRRRLALVAAGSLLATGAAVGTAPGQAVTDWLADAVRSERPPARPALGALPGGGRLLVGSPGGVWVVAPDGARRRLGPYADATWSPQGRFVAATRGRQLLALTPRGEVRWALSSPGAVTHPRWAAPDGFRIAYLSGRDLRVVAGDGSGDRGLARAVTAVAPAWRPVPGHALTYVDGAGRLVHRAADGGRVLWRRAGGAARVVRLEWSPDARTLLVARSDGAELLDARGRRVATVAAGGEVVAAALRPSGREVALVRWSARERRSQLVVGGRVVFAAPGRVGDVAWSPGGRWLLAGWDDADQWLFVEPRGRRRVVAVAGVARQFDPSATAGRGAPSLLGWCCPPVPRAPVR